MECSSSILGNYYIFTVAFNSSTRLCMYEVAEQGDRLVVISSEAGNVVFCYHVCARLQGNSSDTEFSLSI